MTIQRRALLALLLAACGSPEVADEGADEATTTGDETSAPPVEDIRSLGPEPTFRDLLAAARTLDDRRDQASDTGCLLARANAGWRLEADLAVAVRPLPDAPTDLEARLAEDGAPVNVLSRWGAYGPGDPASASFVAVTTTLPPQHDSAMVWVVTERGTYVRFTERPQETTLPGSPRDAVAALGDPSELGALFVSAEAGLPLDRLADALAQVPEALAGRVALAVALEPDTRLPTPPAGEASGADAACPDGLPPLDEDAAFGSLQPQVIMSSLGPLRQGAEICVGTTGGPGAAGGRVVLALRIGPDGRITEACAVEDEAGDPALRACLAEAARATAFPAPDPAGYVDVQLPLALAPVASQRQRPLCR